MLLADAVREYTTTDYLWLGFGFAGQLVFGMRFLVQWIVSEREGRSTVPVVFWYMSIVGGLVLFVYAAFYLKDPVISVGQATGSIVYVRNLMLVSKERRMAETS